MLPEAAKEHSQAGARAFVKHYIEALNYSFQSNDPRSLRSISSDDCTVCAELIAAVQKLRKTGGEQRGGLWTASKVSFVPTQPANAPIALVTVELAEGLFKTGRNAPAQEIRAQRINQEYRLSWGGRVWELEDVRNL
ncbi:MAG: hypothetical protein H0V49_00130 [Nocardioidaceae bacterium]|nr:hypothetical protein [Nocardioidaceae bacterium]